VTAMPIRSLTVSRSLEIKNRKLDLLWVALSMVLAVFTWRYAIPDAYTPIWLFVALHIQCAFIFAIRQPARSSTKRPLEILVTLVSLTYFLAFEVKPSSSAVLALLGGVVTAIGSIITFISIQYLGRSFAVLPSLRDIRTSGMYRFVRHPIYLSYIVAGLGTLMRHPSLYNSSVVLAGVLLMMWRIRFEERLLTQDELYRNYMDAVRYRLIPSLY
jgi:protein-S-isoprenylcysteine O-methyltransferase Ste14